MPPVAVAAVGVAVAVGGTAMQISASKKQTKEMKKAAKFERQKSELQSARQRTTAVREARTTYANAQQAAENQGVSTSSVAQGGQASITSQLNSNLSFLDHFNYLSDQAGRSMDRAASAQSSAGIWGAVAGIGSRIYAESGGIPFKGPKPPTNGPK